jgi:hypothetical protein
MDVEQNVPLRKNGKAFFLSADAGKFCVVRTRKRNSEMGDRTGAANTVTKSARIDCVITQVLPEVYQLRPSDQMRFPVRLFHCISKFLLF